MRASLALGLVLAAASVVVPWILAQEARAQGFGVQVEVEDIEDPVRPLSDLANTNVTVEVPCDAVSEQGSRAVYLNVASEPSWVTTTVSPSTVYVDATDCDGNTTARSRTDLVVQTGAQAPAFETGNVTVQGESDGMDPGTDDVAVTAGFYGRLDAQTPRPVVVAEPKEVVDLEVTITNLGNGPMAVTPEMVNRSASDQLKVVLPAKLTVGSNTTSEPNQRAMVVSVQTPFSNGYVDETETLGVLWTGVYAPDPDAGGSASVTRFQVTTKGFHAPGPGPLLTGLGLVGAALAARARRRRPREPQR
jgi:hypothetical protein